MKPSQLLSKLAWEKTRSANIEYTDALILVRHENPSLARAVDSGAPSAPEIANERAAADRRSAANKRNAARDTFIRAVHDYQGKYRVDYQTAYSRCLNDPQFANDVAAMNAPLPQLPSITPGQYYTFTITPQQAMALGISGTYTAADVEVKLRDNGKNLNAADLAFIWQGLKTYSQQTSGLSDSAADARLRSLFPALAARIDSLRALGAAN